MKQRVSLGGILLGVGVALAAGLASAQPANDDFGSAIPLVADSTTTGTTLGATNDGSATCGSSGLSPDVWYTFSPPTDGGLDVSLCGSSYDTVISVHNASPPSTANQVGCNDDSDCGLQSRLLFETTGGQTYWVRVSGWGGNSGDFVLSAFVPTPTPSPTPLVPLQAYHRIAIENPLPNTADYFGMAMDADDQYLVAGARTDDLGAVDTGVVHVFDEATGDLILTIPNPFPGKSSEFGRAVQFVGPGGGGGEGPAMVGRSEIVDGGGAEDGANGAIQFPVDIVVGAPFAFGSGRSASGTAYLMDTQGFFWGEYTRSNPQAGDQFGWEIAEFQGVVAIGALRALGGKGAVYLYDSGPNLARTIPNPISSTDDFGRGIALDDRFLVVGARLADDGPVDSGTAWVYNANDPTTVTFQLRNPSPVADDQFGWSVGISDRLLVVGAHRKEVGAFQNAGAIYLFDDSDGSLVREIPNPEPSTDAQFGRDFETSGTLLLVGARNDRNGRGKAFLIDSLTGGKIASFTHPDPRIDDHFGRAMAFMPASGYPILRVAVGAENDEPSTIQDVGSINIYTIQTPIPETTSYFVNWD